MTWAQVLEAAAAGFEIGSHTKSHARLSDISHDMKRLSDELTASKQIIEAKTGGACISFAWPYGTNADVDEKALEEIRAAGYLVSFSAVRGRVEPGSTDLFQVPRHQIEMHWPLSHAVLWAKGFRESNR